uniref:hypothetical protein n=1 Tax=Thaumasiovibrio occultus TaxID=1891184 RepID=UPI000B35FEE7|nr:hypothetical protein [Thaumasiovibrio occultus]
MMPFLLLCLVFSILNTTRFLRKMIVKKANIVGLVVALTGLSVFICMLAGDSEFYRLPYDAVVGLSFLFAFGLGFSPVPSVMLSLGVFAGIGGILFVVGRFIGHKLLDK